MPAIKMLHLALRHCRLARIGDVGEWHHFDVASFCAVPVSTSIVRSAAREVESYPG